MARASSLWKLVDAHHHLLAALDRALIFVRGLLHFALHVAGFDGAQHSADGVDPRNVFARAGFNSIREVFNRVRSRHGIHGVYHAGFVRQNLLRAQGDQRGIFRGQRQRFVEARWCAATGSRRAPPPSA